MIFISGVKTAIGITGMQIILRMFLILIFGCVTHTEVIYDADHMVLTGTDERILSKNKMTETVCQEFDGRGSLFSFILLKIMNKYPNIESFDDVEIYSDGKCYYVEFNPCYK